MGDRPGERFTSSPLGATRGASFSHRAYSEAFFRQDTEHFIRGLENAWRAFGGVARTVNLDNLNAAVLHADWADLDHNPKLSSCAPLRLRGVALPAPDPRTQGQDRERDRLRQKDQPWLSGSNSFRAMLWLIEYMSQHLRPGIGFSIASSTSALIRRWLKVARFAPSAKSSRFALVSCKPGWFFGVTSSILTDAAMATRKEVNRRFYSGDGPRASFSFYILSSMIAESTHCGIR